MDEGKTRPADISDAAIVFGAVREAQAVLADYIEPDGRHSEAALNRLLAVLDDQKVVEALDRIDPEGRHRGRPPC